MGEASTVGEFMRTHCRCETCACASDFMVPPGWLRCCSGEWDKPWLTRPKDVCEAYCFNDETKRAELDRLLDRWHEAAYQDGAYGEVE